jgi:hypothetical protein
MQPSSQGLHCQAQPPATRHYFEVNHFEVCQPSLTVSNPASQGPLPSALKIHYTSALRKTCSMKFGGKIFRQ